jgi:hypothetical protein
MLQGNWGLAVGWVEVPGVGEAEAAHCRNVELEALVVVGGRSNVETIAVVGGAQDVCDPGSLYTRALVPSGARSVLLKSKQP